MKQEKQTNKKTWLITLNKSFWDVIVYFCSEKKKKAMMVNVWCDMFTSQTILLQTEFAG